MEQQRQYKGRDRKGGWRRKSESRGSVDEEALFIPAKGGYLDSFLCSHPATKKTDSAECISMVVVNVDDLDQGERADRRGGG